MATLTRSQEFRKSAENLIICSICTEVYKQPKVLPCQHTFCLPCLQNFIDSCNQNRILKVTNFLCPSCRKIHFIPSGGIQDFPNDFKVTQICDFLEQLDLEQTETDVKPAVLEAAPTGQDSSTEREEQDKVSKPRKAVLDNCEICNYQDKESEAKFFCTSCGKYLCDACQHHHEENPVFSEHYTLQVETGSEESAILICQDHQEEVKYFCDDCESALCTVCALGTHGKHSLADISTSLARQRHLVASGLESLRDRLGEYEQEAQDLADMKEQHQTSYHLAKDSIRTQTQKAKESLEKQQEVLLNTLDNSHSEIMENLEEQERSIHENMSAITEVCKEASEVIEPEKVLKLLASFSDLKKRLNDSLIEPVQELKMTTVELPVFEASNNVSIGSLNRSAVQSLDETDNGILKKPETPKPETPKEVRFSMHEEVQDISNTAPLPPASPERSEVTVTLASPQQPIVVNMTTIKTDSGFQSQVSEISQNGEGASESDDEVFVDTNTHAPQTSDIVPQSATGKVAISTELKWQSNEVQDSRGLAFYPDASLAVTSYRNSGNPVKIYDSQGRNKKVTPGVSDYVIKPWAAAINPQSSHLVVSDHGDSAVKVLDKDLAVTQTWRRMFNKPCGVAALRTGEYVVTDGGSRHFKASIHLPSGLRIRDFAKKGTENGCLLSPNYVTVDQQDRIVISDCDNHAIRIFDRLGKQLTGFTWKSPNGQLMQPQGVCVTGRNNIVVADQAYSGVLLFNSDGRFITTLVQTETLPWAVSVHESGILAVSTEGGIQVYSVS